MAEKLNLKKLAFIGGGAMGEAIIKGITSAKLMDPAAIFVGAHRQERAEYLHETYGVTGLVDNCEAVKDADMVVLAIKPQMVDSVLRGALVSAVPGKAVIVSIMGSVTIEKIAGIFKGHPIIRTMPNTPLAVGAGMTAIATRARTPCITASSSRTRSTGRSRRSGRTFPSPWSASGTNGSFRS